MFDLVRYIVSNNVPYIDRGPNVQRGNINVRCPFCISDPSMHMGVSITSGSWGCWRNPAHRGKKPHRLLRALFSLSWDAIDSLVDSGVAVADPVDVLIERAAKLGERETLQVEVVEFPAGMKTLRRNEFTLKYYQYLERRGFSAEQADILVQDYGLSYQLIGPWQNRIVFPVRLRSQLIGWTARAIGPAEIKYRAHPTGQQIKNSLLNYDAAAEGGRSLVVVEGPFDTVKFDFFARAHAVRCVGLMGAAVTTPQINALVPLARRFDSVFLLLDPDAQVQSLNLEAQLRVIGATSIEVPSEFEDPGAMTGEAVTSFAKQLAQT